MSQFVDNHPLARDLPEHKDTIHVLKMNDAHFAKIMEEYEVLDKGIVRAEQGLEHIADLELDGMKMKRVQMKDDLLAHLQKAR